VDGEVEAPVREVEYEEDEREDDAALLVDPLRDAPTAQIAHIISPRQCAPRRRQRLRAQRSRRAVDPPGSRAQGVRPVRARLRPERARLRPAAPRTRPAAPGARAPRAHHIITA